MDIPPIEQTLQPETVNEMILIERIRQLKRQMYVSGRDPYSLSPDPNEIEIKLDEFHPTLTLAASVKADEDPNHPTSLRVHATSFNGSRSIGHAYYVGAETLASLSPYQAANMLGDLHKKTIRDLAELLMNS